MSGFGGTWPLVLSAVIDAARSALRDLDEKEIPAGLSRVASYQGGRLPPPLAVRLLKELDENEWLRSKVVEQLDDELDHPSSLFLRRPAGWWVELAAHSEAADAGREARRLRDLEARLRRTEAKRALASTKAKEFKRAAEDAKKSAKELADSAKTAAEQRFEAELAESSALQEQLSDERHRVSDLVIRHSDLQDAFAALRSRFAKARRGRSDETEGSGGSSSVPSDPVKLARMLDLQAAAYGREVGTSIAKEPESQDPFMLAAGVRPDSSDAIRWLIGLDEPVVVLVDGYNAQFHIDRGDFTSGVARRRLVDALRRLRSVASAKHRFVVVYDSTLPGDRVARNAIGGIEVRFAEEERIADEEIVDMAAEFERVVVISSDRAVREGAETQGAVVLWSEALSDWLGRS